MATLGDIALAAGVNILSALIFLILFAIARIQPINDQISQLGARTLKMPEPELIDHAGLDSSVYLRIYLLGFKIFVPVPLLVWSILVLVNWTNNTLAESQAVDQIHFSDIDKLSISNVPTGSPRGIRDQTIQLLIVTQGCPKDLGGCNLSLYSKLQR